MSIFSCNLHLVLGINVSLDASDHICQSRVSRVVCHVSLGGVLALVAGLHLVLELLHLQRHLVQLVPGQGNVQKLQIFFLN